MRMNLHTCIRFGVTAIATLALGLGTGKICIAQGTGLSPDQTFVTQLYSDLLSRPPAADERDNLTQLIPAIGRPLPVSMIVQSQEALTYVVDSMFMTYLFRAADPGSELWWVSNMQSGLLKADQLRRWLIASDEYFATRADNNNGGFLVALYLDLLNRPITPDEALLLSTWMEQGITRDDVIFLVMNGWEYRSNEVQGIISAFLRRPASDIEIAFWTAAFLSGLAADDFTILVLASDEYYQYAQGRW